jgi:HK97 family phage portal protein
VLCFRKYSREGSRIEKEVSFFTKVARALPWNEKKEKRYSLSDLDRRMDFDLSGQAASSGVHVSPDSALNYSAYFNGVQQIAQTVASLPWNVFKKVGSSAVRYTQNSLELVLSTQTNGYQNANQYKELIVYDLIVWGNSYSFIEYANDYRVSALYRIPPDNVTVMFDYEKKEKVYKIKSNITNETKNYSQAEIFHIAGFSSNGMTGMSILSHARESIGLGLAEQVFAGRFFGGGTNVGAIFTHPEKLSDTAKANLKKAIQNQNTGIYNSHKIMVLEEGLTFNRTTMPLRDAQFLEARQFSVQEVARWLNIPPHKLKDLSRATFSNISEEQLSFFTDTIRPWIIRIESAANTQLINPASWGRVYTEFNFNAILRADIKTRFESYSIALQNGFLSRNEVRNKENMNPIDGNGGDVYTAQLNLTSVENLSYNGGGEIEQTSNDRT